MGGVPLTTSIVHGSVNGNARARPKLSTILQGGLLLAPVALARQVP
jgi:hypothetical protein